MSINTDVRPQHPQALPDVTSIRRGRGSRCARVLLVLSFACVFVSQTAWAGANFDLQTAPGGITLTQVGNNYTSTFGSINALGIGAPAAGVTVIPLSNGTLYYASYQLFVHGGLPGNQTGYVTAYASSNFARPIALVLQSCPSSGSCNTAAQYSAMSTSAAVQTTVIAAPGISKNQTVAAGLAIFVPDNNGASAWSGTDSVTISFTMYNGTVGGTIETLQWSINSVNLQTAVGLTLSSAAGGLTISPATDYSANFGNVNAMGIGPAAGLTTSAVPGGVIYATPFQYSVAFSDFNSFTGTVTAYVSTNFVHSNVLVLHTATALVGPYSNFSTSSVAPTILTSNAADRSTGSSYLGLFVSNINGPTAFSGPDNAILTLTLTVP
ncbi:MAG: hypothetical protein ACRD3E_14825 [Terriglobales bacterium]